MIQNKKYKKQTIFVYFLIKIFLKYFRRVVIKFVTIFHSKIKFKIVIFLNNKFCWIKCYLSVVLNVSFIKNQGNPEKMDKFLLIFTKSWKCVIGAKFILCEKKPFSKRYHYNYINREFHRTFESTSLHCTGK